MNHGRIRLGKVTPEPNCAVMIPSTSLLAVTAAAWFGPAPAQFDAAPTGNPYDFRGNDVRVVFVADDGHREERLAYYDAGQWKAWLTAAHPGTYHATLVRNGKAVETPAVTVRLEEAARLRDGFVRREGPRFRLDSGAAFYPIGYNLGWRGPGEPPLPEHLQRMGAAGLNWSRVWACAWDGKNPFVPRAHQAPPVLGEFLPEPLAQWDGIVAAAEAAGVRLQFVLFHHGLVSTRNDSNWAGHPWNRANGGFLDRPQEFFTDPTAKEYQKRWLRYAVARWGHSPAIMAWELFNEVEWVDAVQTDRDWPTVIGWHAEMAAFLRELDPYHHLVTTSAAREQPELYRAMDYFQPHTYPRDVFNGIAGVVPEEGKPWFFGEFGRGTWEQNSDEHLVVRDGIWAGLLSAHAGAAQYWFWDRVLALGLEPEFTRATRLLAWSRLAERGDARPAKVTIDGAPRGPLVFAPGRGWGATTRSRFTLPAAATPENLVQLSSYLQAQNGANAALNPGPLEFAFEAPGAGEVVLTFTSLSGQGAGLRVSVDGVEVQRTSWPAAQEVTVAPTGGRAHQPAPAPLRIPITAGARVLRVENTGPDWVQLDRLEFPAVGRAVQAHAIATHDFALVRVQATAAGLGCVIDLQIEGPEDGAYRLQSMDLNTGTAAERTVELFGGRLRGWTVDAADTALVLTRR